MSAEDGNALFSVFPLDDGASARAGIARGGDEYAWPDLYPSSTTRIGIGKDGNLYPPATGGPVVPLTYGLAAVDTGVGRRYWQSPTVNFASAPSPIGAWVTPSLTILYAT